MSDAALLALAAAYREDPSDANAHRLAAHVSRLEAPATRKVLISPGYGAGFSTFLPPEFRQLAAEFAPLVEAVESGGARSKRSRGPTGSTNTTALSRS